MNREKAISRLKNNGYKMTRQRQDILQFFESADGYRSAKSLIYFMEKYYDHVSFDTIYRNLHLFYELNILEKTVLQGEKHFRISCTDEHHHHFICQDCGKTKKIYYCPMNYVENSLKNYMIEDHKFEIYGLCPSCKIA